MIQFDFFFVFFRILFCIAEHTPSFKFYVEAERKGHMYTKRLSYFVFINISCSAFGMAAVNACYNMYIGNWDPTTYFLPYKLLIPFVNYHTISGFFIQWLVQIYCGYTYILTISAVVMYFLSCCYYIDACCLDFERVFIEIDEKVKNNIKSNVRLSNEIRIKIRDSIVFHIKIMQ